MRLEGVSVRREARRIGLTARVQRSADPRPFEVSFWYPSGVERFVSDTADAFVPVLLLPAMAAGEPLEIAPPISARLLKRLAELQEIFAAWYPQALQRVAISAKPRIETEPIASDHVAAFFSCGVDAFYTLLEHVRKPEAAPRRLTHLLFMRGIETPLPDTRSDDATISRAQEVASATGLELIVGETDLRTHFPLVWGMYCGAGLAGTALSLSAGFSEVLIPSSLAYGEFEAWGSHPLVDELWSSERLTVRSDGAEARRAEKIERVVGGDPLARRHLRVCTHNAGGGSNCGRCAKCIRTMVALHACGELGRAETFPRSLPPDVETLVRSDTLSYAEENLRLCGRTGKAPDTAAMLGRVLRRGRRKKALRELLEASLSARMMERIRGLRSR